ncbi:MAG: multiple resistance and pH regulation protein F [Candidatus Hydrogenedentes bacterium]|nr:multiple resistance and pH regulation protein F [Candidatus Hydrogenedentota bacterium]
MKTLRWTLGLIVLAAVLGALLLAPPTLPLVLDDGVAAHASRAIHVLLIGAVLGLLRVLAGPTVADRIMAIDILGVLIVGICAVLGIASGHSWYLDIAIAWALQSFIGVLALAKHLEGRRYDA